MKKILLAFLLISAFSVQNGLAVKVTDEETGEELDKVEEEDAIAAESGDITATGNYLSKILDKLGKRELICQKGYSLQKFFRPRLNNGMVCKVPLVAAFMLANCKDWTGKDPLNKSDKFNGSGCEKKATAALKSSKLIKDGIDVNQPAEAFKILALKYARPVLEKACSKNLGPLNAMCSKAQNLIKAPAPIAGTTGQLAIKAK